MPQDVDTLSLQADVAESRGEDMTLAIAKEFQ
jgi:hypothetical protein